MVGFQTAFIWSFYLLFQTDLFLRTFAIGIVQFAFGNIDIDTDCRTDFGIDFVGDIRVFFQPNAYIVFTLADFCAVVAVPCTGFLNDVMFDAQVNQFAFPADAFTVKNIEFGLTERRRNFVFDDFDFGFVTNNVIAFLI